MRKSCKSGSVGEAAGDRRLYPTTKLGSCNCRYSESRALEDSFDDHLPNGSRSLGTTYGDEGLKRCSLLRDLAIDAIAHETTAKSHERGHCANEPPPSNFGRKCTGVS